MKLKRYSEYINALAEKYPDAEVIYSQDGVLGESFGKICFQPTAGTLKGFDFEAGEGDNVNAVCLN